MAEARMAVLDMLRKARRRRQDGRRYFLRESKARIDAPLHQRR